MRDAFAIKKGGLIRANLRFSYEIASNSGRCTIYFDDNRDNIRQHSTEKALCGYDDNGDNRARFTRPPCGMIVAPKGVMVGAGCKPNGCAGLWRATGLTARHNRYAMWCEVPGRHYRA